MCFREKPFSMRPRHSLEKAFFKHISKKEHPRRNLSSSLRFGRDDKGEGGASMGESFLDESRFYPLRCAVVRNNLRGRPIRRW
jgi:hypothetical protein